MLQGLTYAGLFFLGFFIGILTMKFARKKEFKIQKKDEPKVKGLMDTGVSTTEVKEAVKVLEQLPNPEEEEKMFEDITRNELATDLNKKSKEEDSDEIIRKAGEELKSVRD